MFARIKNYCSSFLIFAFIQTDDFLLQRFLLFVQRDNRSFNTIEIILYINICNKFTGRVRSTGWTGQIFRKYISSLCGWGKPQRIFHTYLPVKAAAFEAREKMDRPAYNSDVDIRAYESHGGRKWGGSVLASIEIYCGLRSVRNISRARDLGEPSFPFLSVLFFLTLSAAVPLLPLLSSRLFSRKFRFLANLCVTSPEIRRINKYHRDNILIDLWYNTLFPIRKRERERKITIFFLNLLMQRRTAAKFILARFRGVEGVWFLDTQFSISVKRDYQSIRINKLSDTSLFGCHDAKSSQTDLEGIRVTKYHFPRNYNGFYG